MQGRFRKGPAKLRSSRVHHKFRSCRPSGRWIRPNFRGIAAVALAWVLTFTTAMGMPTVALLVLIGAAVYFMTPSERKRLLEAALDRGGHMIRELRADGPQDPLHELLMTRTRWPIAAPLLILVCVIVWLGMILGSGPSGPQLLIDYGASVAPRTTNGEWWRLLGYTFVHAGPLHLLATIAALFSLGILLERLVGGITFAAVYVAAGMVSGSVSLWAKPATSATIGASGAVFGLYGLLAAVVIYGYVREPRLPWSPLALKRLAAGAALFLLYNLFSDYVDTVSELAGLATGLAIGLLVARGIVEEKPAMPRAALVPAGVALVAILAALPLRGTIDARPEIARVVDFESRTSSEYAKAVDAFTHGRMSAKALAQVIQKSILPALQADKARIDTLRGVPVEQAPLVAAAREYFELRETSWRRRVEALTGSSMPKLRDADKAERSALDAFERLQRNTAALPQS